MRIYLDHNATTPLAASVLDSMLPWLQGKPANASSIHQPGREARAALQLARQKCADAWGCDPRRLVFTSGGTEGNNAAVKSALDWTGKKHVILSSIEHASIRVMGESLERSGVAVSWIPVDHLGRVDPARVTASMRDDTALVSIMWANNETGVIQPVREIGEQCRQRGILFHTDAVQAAGKLAFRLEDEPIDLASISAHKFSGPQGVGALYIHRRIGWVPQILGGGQESGRRGGTENVAGVVGMGQAAAESCSDEYAALKAVRDGFETEVMASLPDVHAHGAGAERLANTSNLCFPGRSAEELLILLDQEGLAASAGSACSTGSLEPSPVLLAMGVKRNDAASSVRFSFGRGQTINEAHAAASIVIRAAGSKL
ncbi:MAG: cysteine desulfurase family protein [Candidatus Methylacidiphilales bacterium]